MVESQAEPGVGWRPQVAVRVLSYPGLQGDGILPGDCPQLIEVYVHHNEGPVFEETDAPDLTLLLPGEEDADFVPEGWVAHTGLHPALLPPCPAHTMKAGFGEETMRLIRKVGELIFRFLDARREYREKFRPARS